MMFSGYMMKMDLHKKDTRSVAKLLAIVLIVHSFLPTIPTGYRIYAEDGSVTNGSSDGSSPPASDTPPATGGSAAENQVSGTGNQTSQPTSAPPQPTSIPQTTVAPTQSTSQPPSAPADTPYPTSEPDGKMIGSTDKNIPSNTSPTASDTPHPGSDITNTADISGSVTGNAETGNNSSSDSNGESVISTSTASATALSTTEVNTTATTAVGSPPSSETPNLNPPIGQEPTPRPNGTSATIPQGSGIPDASVSGTAASLQTASPTPSVLDLNNEATVSQSATASASTGTNTIANAAGDSAIITGNAYGNVFMANLVNTNSVGSKIRFFVINVDSSKIGSVDLNALWNRLAAETATVSGQITALVSADGTLIDIKNTANVDVSLAASSITGHNTISQNGGNAVIATGNAYSAADLFNLINTNIIGSNLLFGVINIFNSLTGNIVIPNYSRFAENAVTPDVSLALPAVAVDNTASLTGSSITAIADTGTNAANASGTSVIFTGNALAQSTETVVANLTNIATAQYRILINNAGFWNGGLSGWDSAADLQNAITGRIIWLGGNSAADIGIPSGTGTASIMNTAHLTYDVSAVAESGGNAIVGATNAGIFSGSATALANAFSMLNTSVIGSDIFFPIINLFGTWNGNLAVAYPDIQVGMNEDKTTAHPGDSLLYTVSYSNRGNDSARNVTLTVALPPELTSVHGPGNVSGNTVTVPVGTLMPGDSGSFEVGGTISPDIRIASVPSLLNRIKSVFLPPVYAATKEKTITAQAQINSSDQQASTDGKTVSVTATIVIDDTETQSGTPAGQSDSSPTPTPDPDAAVAITAGSSTNVGDYIHPGDTILFTLKAKNTGANPLTGVLIQHAIVNSQGMIIASVPFPVGYLDVGKTATVTYGLIVPPALPAGTYTSNVTASGWNVAGTKQAHDSANTSFLVKTGSFPFVGPVEAASDNPPPIPTGTVKGASTVRTTGPTKTGSIWLYIILLILALIVVAEYEYWDKRRQDEKRKIRETPDESVTPPQSNPSAQL